MRPSLKEINALRMVVPMPRSQPEFFGRWLKEVIKVPGLGPEVIAKEAHLTAGDIKAIIANAPGSSKGMRRDAYEAAMVLMDRKFPTKADNSMFMERDLLRVYFTGVDGEHEGQCLRILSDAIVSAKRSVRVMAYWLTSSLMLEALGKAARAGIDVQVIHDPAGFKQARKYPQIRFIPDTIHRKAHNKVIIIDDEEVFTGSFNFTNAADDKNAENLVVIRDRKIVRRYLDYWENTRVRLERSGRAPKIRS